MALWQPKPLESVDILGLGASVYSYVSTQHDFFPDRDPGTHEVWTINAGVKLFRVDACFDIHTKEYLDEQYKRETAEGSPITNPDRALKRREWLKNNPGKPIIMAKSDPDIPDSYTYPLRRIIEHTQCAYFDTGLAYIIAAAMLSGVKKIGLYGCDYAYNIPGQNNREDGRSCAEFWVGYAKGSGIEIYVPNVSSLLSMIEREHGRLYGYHEPLQAEVNPDGTGKFIGPDYE